MNLKLITVWLAVVACLANARSLEEKRSASKVARRGMLRNVARDFNYHDKFTRIDVNELLQCVVKYTDKDYIPGKGEIVFVNMVDMVKDCICPRKLYDCEDEDDYNHYYSNSYIDPALDSNYYPSDLKSWDSYIDPALHSTYYPSDLTSWGSYIDPAVDSTYYPSDLTSWDSYIDPALDSTYYPSDLKSWGPYIDPALDSNYYPSDLTSWDSYIDPALDSTHYPSDLKSWDFMKRKQAKAEERVARNKEGQGSGGFGSKEKEGAARRELAQRLRSSNVEKVKKILTELKNLQKSKA